MATYSIRYILIFCISTLSLFSVFSQEIRTITLEEAYTIATGNSKDLAIQNISLAIQKRSLQLSIRSMLPQVSVSGNNNVTLNQNATDSYSRSISTTVQQPLFQGGQLIYNRNLTRAKVQIEQQKASLAYYNLIKSVWENYFSILQTRQELNIRKETFSILQQQEAIVEAQKKQGTITELNYIETQIQIQTEEVAIKKLELQLYTQQSSFAQLLGIPPLDIAPFKLADFQVTYEPISIPPENYPKAVALAINSSLDLKEKYILLNETRSQLLFNRLQFIPSISLQGSAQVSGETFPLNSYNYSLGVSLSFANWGSPISNSASVSSSGQDILSTSESGSIAILQDITQLTSRDSIKLQEKQQIIEIETLEKNFRENIPQQIKLINFQQEEYLLQENTLELEKQKRALYILQNAQGSVTSLKLIEYLLEYQQKEIALVQARFALEQAIKELEFSLGIYQGSIQSIL